MPLPTYVVGGVMKSGTSTLHWMLKQHPQVKTAKPKELHFFDRRYRRGLEWYAEQFTPRSDHLAWGETTPSYLYNTLARRRLVADLPDVRFIAILREPASRAYSHYQMMRSKGVEPIEVFEDALAAEAQRVATDERYRRQRFAYTGLGRYAPQLRALESSIGRERMHVLLMEDLLAEPQAAMSGIFDFIGVDPGFQVSLVHRKVAPPVEGAPQGMRYPPMSADTRAELRASFRAPNLALQRWLGRDLSAWL